MKDVTLGRKKKDVEDKCLDTVGAHTHTHTHDSQSVFGAALPGLDIHLKV